MSPNDSCNPAGEVPPKNKFYDTLHENRPNVKTIFAQTGISAIIRRMELERFERAAMVYGEDAIKKLRASSVAVFGLGGVGGTLAEALARAGVGRLLLVDGDRVERSNINRQMVALESTLGQYKTDVMRARILDICPDTQVETLRQFYTPENAREVDLAAYDAIADAIDMVSAKIELAVNADAAGTPLCSCMGVGNKMRPDLLQAGDIYETSVCPLARILRRELRARGIGRLRVVYSTEAPVSRVKGRTPGSSAFVPPAAGLLMASEIVKILLAASLAETS